MGIFDIFSAGPGEKAAQDQQNALNAAYAQYAALNQQAQNQLTQQFGQGQAAINQYFPQAGQALQTNYTAGLQPAQAAAASTQAGTDQLLRALGIAAPGGGGQPGGQDMQALLAGTPGYQFALDQGTQNVMRNQAASGSLGSGGSDAALLNYGTGLANQTYNQYIQSLLPFLQQNTATTGNVLQGYGNLGNQLSNVNTGQGLALQQGAQNLGTGLAGLTGNLGSAAYGTQAGIGNAQAQGDLAGQKASANIFNALGGLAGLGVNLLGAGGGAGAKALFGGFGGGAPGTQFAGYNTTGGTLTG
jgi:hypothetical protein